MYGATAGKTAILGVPATTNQAICAIMPNGESFDSQFLQFQLIHIRPRLLNARSGGAQPNISQTVLKTLDVVLPPLPEQRAIAHILRAVQAAREARQREVSLERERKAALMAHLFTHGTRGEPTKLTPIGEMPASWEVVELGEIISEGPQNGIYKHASLYGEGTHILRIDDFDNDGNFVNLSLNQVRLTPHEVDRYRLSKNDLVINRVNSLSHLGKCALIPQFTDVTVFESNMMRFRVDETQVTPGFIFRLLTTQGNRDRVRGMAREL